MKQRIEKVQLDPFFVFIVRCCAALGTYLKYRFSKILKKFSDFLPIEPLLHFMMVGTLTIIVNANYTQYHVEKDRQLFVHDIVHRTL